MIQAPDLPQWAAFLVGLLVLIGAIITLTGTLGLLRLQSFYERVHAPTLGATLGAGAILVASMICFSVLQTRLVIHEVLIAVFLTITTPITPDTSIVNISSPPNCCCIHYILLRTKGQLAFCVIIIRLVRGGRGRITCHGFDNG